MCEVLRVAYNLKMYSTRSVDKLKTQHLVQFDFESFQDDSVPNYSAPDNLGWIHLLRPLYLIFFKIWIQDDAEYTHI